MKLSGKNVFYIGDNSFNFGEEGRERAILFAEELIRRKIRCHFWVQMRLDDAIRDLDIMPLLRKAGLYQIQIGIETIHPSIMDTYKKWQDLAQIQEVSAEIRKNNIMLMGCFVLGDYEDTEESLWATHEWAKGCVDYYAPSIATPLPGTEYHDEMKEKGHITTRDYRRYDYRQGVIQTKTMTPDQVNDWQLEALTRFYERPGMIFRSLFSPNKQFRKNTRFYFELGFRTVMQNKYGWGEWKQPGFMPFQSYLDIRGYTQIQSTAKQLGYPIDI
jgi:anaerobic magnesium-protoporphyrin IX monomethyl ester cyclase